MHLAAGTLVDKRFKILRPLGAGGMGTVYEAEQVELGRTVAIKFLNDPNMAEEEAFARFQQEAQIISHLLHKNIVGVYAFGQWRNMPYMVMERVQGTNLQEMLNANKPLDQKFVLDLAAQVCAGLHQAHEAGVVHRDIKPSNLIVADNGDVKIIDFGFAKLVGPNSGQRQKLTEAGAAIGSVLYMSPEQCTGSGVDRRSDIYSLGCVLHHCLTGTPPFAGDHSVVVMMQHISEQAPRVEKLCPGIELLSGIQTLLDAAMAKQPDLRYQSAEELRLDIETIQKGERISRNVIVEPSPAKSERKSRLPRAVVALSVVALLGVGLMALSMFPKRESTDTVDDKQMEIVKLQRRVNELEPRVGSLPPEETNPEEALEFAIATHRLTVLEGRFNVRANPTVVIGRKAIFAAKTSEQKLHVFEKLVPHISLQDGGEELHDVMAPLLDDIDQLLRNRQYEQARQTCRHILELNQSKHGPAARVAIFLLLERLMKCDSALGNKQWIDSDAQLCLHAMSQFHSGKYDDLQKVILIADMLHRLREETVSYALMREAAGPFLAYGQSDGSASPSETYVWHAIPLIKVLLAHAERDVSLKLIAVAQRMADVSGDGRQVANAYAVALGYDVPHAVENAKKAIARLKHEHDIARDYTYLASTLANRLCREGRGEEAVQLLNGLTGLPLSEEVMRRLALFNAYRSLHRLKDADACNAEALKICAREPANALDVNYVIETFIQRAHLSILQANGAKAREAFAHARQLADRNADRVSISVCNMLREFENKHLK